MTKVLAFNPAQVRAPKGTETGGQWMDTPGEVLEGLEAYRIYEMDRWSNTPVPFNPDSAEPQFHMTEGNKSPLMADQEIAARFAYMNDTGHATISNNLRSGAISPPRDGATYGDFGYFDPRQPNGAVRNPFDGQYQVLGDGAGVVHALDGAIADNWMTEPVTVYRGLSVEPDADFSPGTRWHEPGFTSTTFNPAAAIEFAKFRAGMPSDFDTEGGIRSEDTSGRPLFMEIILPPGTHFMPGAEAVDELILERGGTFEVLENLGDSITVRFEPFDTTVPEVQEDA